PDIVITSIRLPGMSGIDLLKFIKEKHPDIEVIIITGLKDLQLAIDCLKMGAVDFITKPVINDILKIALTRARDRIENRIKFSMYTRNLETLVEEKTRKLVESENRYIQLFDESPSFIIIVDKKFKIIEANKMFRKQYGDIIGKHCYRVYQGLKTPLSGCPVKKTFNDQKSHVAEMEVTLGNGEIRNLLLQTSALKNPDGQILHVMEMATDVTVIHQLKDHLAALGLHISSISHGIKGLLSGLDGGDYMITLGLETGNAELIKDGWDIAKRKIKLIRRMVLDILFNSKDRALDRRPVNVFDFIQELVTTMAPKMKKAGIFLVQDTPKPKSDDKILIDETVFFAALLAIFENAVDACVAVKDIRDKLEIKISVELKKKEAIFRIRDNGKGLARKYQKEAFSLFYSDKGKKGTGLGLFIAQRSVKQHGGVIKINSTPGQYTQFTIIIPVQYAES
ncbi:MAG: response regulator, partial [Desulfobacula sp.]|nr:response regulator [Desulfobacula sp.]